MIIDLRIPEHIDIEDVGGKAYNLHKLVRLGIPVPAAIVIPASVHRQFNQSDEFTHLLKETLMDHELFSHGSNFAVRSSGVGEDGEANSYAGIFESYLDIPADQVFEAVQKVWQSISTRRSKMYSNERSSSVVAMAVVVQKMVSAD